jgi:hypothetical protein
MNLETNELINSNSIREAKAFILQRIEAELTASRYAADAIGRAVREIIALARRYSVPTSSFRFADNRKLNREVNAIISRLRQLLYEYTQSVAATADQEDKEAVIAHINTTLYGKTLTQRITEHTETLKNETQTAIANGIAYNPTSSARNAIDRLLRNTVAIAYMYAYGLSATRRGAIGFISMRGSSYPCQTCDDNVGYHDIAEYNYAWHVNCRCIFIFIYPEDLYNPANQNITT